MYSLRSSTRNHKGWGDDLDIIGRGRHVTAAPGPVDVDVLISLELGILLSGEDAEGVSTKVVTLSLEDIGGDNLAPVTIQEGKGRREGRSWNTPENSLSDDTPPAGLSFLDG